MVRVLSSVNVTDTRKVHKFFDVEFCGVNLPVHFSSDENLYEYQHYNIDADIMKSLVNQQT